MDSSAYLTRHGWLGDGHALHPGGIKKPLLVSKKANVLGLGKKKNDAHADQWWARAFDSGLKNLEIGQVAKDSSNEPFKGRSRSTLELVQTGGGKWAGLYSGFVKGQVLSGTKSSPEFNGQDGPQVTPLAVFHAKIKRDDTLRSPKKGNKGTDDRFCASKRENETPEERRMRRQRKKEKRLKRLEIRRHKTIP